MKESEFCRNIPHFQHYDRMIGRHICMEMNELDLLFIVLPAFMIFLAGFIGQKLIGFEIRSISQMALYIMSPFLAFRTFYTNALTVEYVYIILFCIILCFVLMAAVWVTALLTKATKQQMRRLLRLEEKIETKKQKR